MQGGEMNYLFAYSCHSLAKDRYRQSEIIYIIHQCKGCRFGWQVKHSYRYDNPKKSIFLFYKKKNYPMNIELLEYYKGDKDLYRERDVISVQKIFFKGEGGRHTSPKILWVEDYFLSLSLKKMNIENMNTGYHIAYLKKKIGFKLILLFSFSY